MKHGHLSIILMLVLAAACKDSTAPDDLTTTPGAVSFTFTGGGGGSYSATGAVQALSQLSENTSTWSVGGYHGSSGIVIVSNQATTGGLANSAMLRIDRRTIGSSEIDLSCSPTAAAPCPMFDFILGLDATGEQFAYVCGLTSGTISITDVSSSSVTGTFSGVGYCASPSLQFSEATVWNGTFTVPLVAGLTFEM